MAQRLRRRLALGIHGFPHDLQRLDRSGFTPDSLFAIDLAIEVAHHQLHTTQVIETVEHVKRSPKQFISFDFQTPS